MKVRVLGTHFSVNSYSDEEQVVVTLEEGSVNVSDSIQTMTLSPNEQLVYSRTAGTMHKQMVDAMAYNSWVKGRVTGRIGRDRSQCRHILLQLAYVMAVTAYDNES